MLIQCTKALLDKIGMKENELSSPEGHEQFPNSFMAWHATFVTINRRKAIILMNNETRYPVVIYRPTKKEFSNIRVLIFEAITEALRIEGVRKDIVDAYIADAGEFSFSKTANRSMVAKLNNTVREVGFMGEYLDKETKLQRYISLVTGRMIQNYDGVDEYHYPIERMLNCFASIYGLDQKIAVDEVLAVERYQLKIQINLDGHDIWRRVIVPSTFSFGHLHHIIQTVFDWLDYHLHEFTVEREEKKPLKIVMDDDPELLQYIDSEDFSIRQERFVSLEEVFPKYDTVVYEYDFGDLWEHIITVEKVEKSNVFQATFLDGNGERPPEDVGGARGFEDYVRIMADKKDPIHNEMKVWAEGLRERKLSSEQINKWIKKVTSGHGPLRDLI